MNRIITFSICAALLLVACNKNKRFNKKLEGSWVQTSVNGAPVDPQNAMHFKFTMNQRDGGNVIMEIYTNGTKGTANGTYLIDDKGNKLIVSATGGAPTLQGTSSYTYNFTGQLSDKTKNAFTSAEEVTGTFISSGLTVPFSRSQVVEYKREP